MSNSINFNPNKAADSNNLLLSGAVATFFDTRTTNPQTVFTDTALFVGVTSLIADASGLFPMVYSINSVNLKVVVKTAGGATLYTVDPAVVNSASSGAADMSFSPITGNVATNVQQAIANNTNFPSVVHSFTANQTFNDDVRALFGSSGDARIYWDNHLRIESDANVYIEPTFSFIVRTEITNEKRIEAFANGQVELYYDAALKFETTLLGAKVTGAIVADGFTPTPRAPAATDSGTVAEYTDIPATATKVELMLSGVSANGTEEFIVQFGDAGGYETTGYEGRCTVGQVAEVSTSGFLISSQTAAEDAYSGIVTFLKFSGNKWVYSGNLSNGTGTNNIRLSAGEKELSDVLTSLRLTTTNTPDTLDGGEINIRVT